MVCHPCVCPLMGSRLLNSLYNERGMLPRRKYFQASGGVQKHNDHAFCYSRKQQLKYINGRFCTPRFPYLRRAHWSPCSIRAKKNKNEMCFYFQSFMYVDHKTFQNKNRNKKRPIEHADSPLINICVLFSCNELGVQGKGHFYFLQQRER